MQVEYIRHGVGFRVGNKIYLNENLKAEPELHNAILNHEKKHTGKFTLIDLELDISNKEIKPFKKQYWKFILKHAACWTQFLPILKIDKRWTWDIGILCVWLFSIFIGVLVWILI